MTAMRDLEDLAADLSAASEAKGKVFDIRVKRPLLTTRCSRPDGEAPERKVADFDALAPNNRLVI